MAPKIQATGSSQKRTKNDVLSGLVGRNEVLT